LGCSNEGHFVWLQHVAALNQPFWARDITPITAKTITGGLNSGGNIKFLKN
jgi:hypothetical protein